jgi:putative acetyltransferase
MSSELFIRKVEKNDEPIMASIIRANFEEFDAPRTGTVYSDPTTDHLFDLFNRPGAILWVALEYNQVVGCCGVYPTEGLPQCTAELVKFYLNPNARGKGIGKQLIETCINSAKEMGYKQLYLESMPQFSNAVNIYKRLGFTMLDEPMGNSGHTSCSIWMTLSFNVLNAS